MKEELNALEKIKQVDAPDFLYDRIIAGINQSERIKAPNTTLVSLAVAAVVLIMLNIGAIVKLNSITEKEGIAITAQDLGLTSSNNFYHE